MIALVILFFRRGNDPLLSAVLRRKFDRAPSMFARPPSTVPRPTMSCRWLLLRTGPAVRWFGDSDELPSDLRRTELIRGAHFAYCRRGPANVSSRSHFAAAAATTTAATAAAAAAAAAIGTSWRVSTRMVQLLCFSWSTAEVRSKESGCLSKTAVRRRTSTTLPTAWPTDLRWPQRGRPLLPRVLSSLAIGCTLHPVVESSVHGNYAADFFLIFCVLF